jgi:hypothetical protein
MMSDPENPSPKNPSPENPLARWSRRKSDARAGQPNNPADEPVAAASNVSAPEDDQPPFDPASLPPIEAIDDKTDLRVFLARGVPAELTRAALRRGWSSDPGIRDFVGLSENSWDFNAPEGISGFGSLTDVQRPAHAVAGEEAMPMSAATTSSNESKAQTAECTPGPEQSQTGSGSQEKSPSDFDAQQHFADSAQIARADVAAIPRERSAPGPDRYRSSRRSHGGALPRIGS